jgi:hypothetical protein
VQVPGLADDRHDRRLGAQAEREVAVRVALTPARRVEPKAATWRARASARRPPEELLVARVRARPAALDVGDPEVVEAARRCAACPRA